MRHPAELRGEPHLELPVLRRLALALCALALAGPSAAPAVAQTAGSAPQDPSALVPAGALDTPPPGRRLTPRQVVRLTRAHPKVRAAVAKEGEGTAFDRAYLRSAGRWQGSVFVPDDAEPRGRREIAQTIVDDRTGRVTEAWTGFQVAWTMARGYEGAFGRKANAPYIWIGLCFAFVLPFLRPPVRLLHLDLAVLLAFSISYAFFNAAQIGVSIPAVYPLLVYLLVRLLAVARGRGRAERPARRPLKLVVSAGFLGIAIVFLLGFRVGLNVTNSNVIDVGYAGVIGAHKVAEGQALYGAFPGDNVRGDTYGPVTYYAYVPFEQVLPWEGEWDDLPAAHGAAILFDLLCVGGLWLLGRRLRGPTFGLLLAYLWVAFPFTLLVSNSNANDSLVGALVLGALLVAGSPAARGGVLALAALAKFAPLGLLPAFATYERRTRGAVVTVAAFAGAAALALVPIALDRGGLDTFYDRTLGFQAGRDSPFSIYGYYGGLEWLQTLVTVAAAALAVVTAFLPRRRDLVSLAALGAATLIALQLTVAHWFYLYLVWFLPLALVALLGDEEVIEPEPAAPGSTAPAAAPARSG